MTPNPQPDYKAIGRRRKLIFFGILGLCLYAIAQTGDGTSAQTAPKSNAQSSERDENYQARLKWWQERMERASKDSSFRPIFECDYTSKLCIRGYRYVGGISIITSTSIYEIIDDADRKTVLERVYCEAYRSETCYFVGSGKKTINGQEYK